MSKILFLVCIITARSSNASRDIGFNDVNVIPRFGDIIGNIMVSVGREATFTCVVDDLGMYKVAWLRVDTQTILSIATHVITKNHRISVTQSNRKLWFLHIAEVRETDRGWYMCQINTEPMKSHTAFLDVVVPPDILDYPSSGDQVMREGSNVTLCCAATGVPTPSVTWRRETGSGEELRAVVAVDTQNKSISSSVVTFVRVNRLQMGSYLCIASNGVPPSVSKRVTLIVHFPPMVWIQNQLIGALEGESVVLECHSEAFPKSINYWTFQGDIISNGDPNYEIKFLEKIYEVGMQLKVLKLVKNLYGLYKCVSKNSLGDTDGYIKLYPIEDNLYKRRSPHDLTVYDELGTNDSSKDILTAAQDDRSSSARIKTESTPANSTSSTINILIHKYFRLYYVLGLILFY